MSHQPNTGTSAYQSTISRDILTNFYILATISPHSPVRSNLTNRHRRNTPTVFIHPKIDSTRPRTFWVDLYAA